MEIFDRLALFGPLDAVAVLLWGGAWLIIGVLIDTRRFGARSVSGMMERVRHEWMQAMTHREVRIFDSNILAIMRQGSSFFASASMIAIGGGLALIGNTERLLGLARDLNLSAAPAAVWEFKILAVLIVVVSAFLKFVWAHRLFGYCATLIAAVPNTLEAAAASPRARQAGEIANSASRSYNGGLRALYFALAGLAWLISPLLLMITAPLTFLVLWRREFASNSRRALAAGPQSPPPS